MPTANPTIEATANVIFIVRVIASTSNEVVRPPGRSVHCQRRPANRANAEGQDVDWRPFDCLPAAPDKPSSRSPLRGEDQESATAPEALCSGFLLGCLRCSESTMEYFGPTSSN